MSVSRKDRNDVFLFEGDKVLEVGAPANVGTVIGFALGSTWVSFPEVDGEFSEDIAIRYDAHDLVKAT